MTNTATPERVIRIAAPGDRVIIMTGTFNGHQGIIETVSITGRIDVRVDVTGQLSLFAPADLAYPDGGRLETYEERRDRENRAATLRRLHRQAVTLRTIGESQGSAIMIMAARYGAAERLKGSDSYDIELTYRAADRRFSAMQRLIRSAGL